jgi:hypothetical protein
MSDRPKFVIRPARASAVDGDAADERDDRVEVVERDDVAFEDVRAGFGLAQLELDAPAHDVAAELDEVLEHLEQREHARAAGHDGQHDDAEGVLELGLLVEVVEDDLRPLARFGARSRSACRRRSLSSRVGDALDLLLAHELGDLLEQRALLTW